MPVFRWRIAKHGQVVTLQRLFVLASIVALTLWATAAASAQITSVSPGSASVGQGGSVGVNVTTDGATVGVAGGHAGISVAPTSGSGPTVRFTFVVGTSVPAGSYAYSFFDDLGGSGSFTLIVNATTTTTTAPTTTTTRAPTTTTTRAPTTTTTRAPTTTTTTAPTTTTTTTLVPSGITALDEGGSGFGGPIAWVFGGGVALAALLAGLVVYRSQRQPTYGAATPGAVLAWRRRRERRRVARQGGWGPSDGSWWNTSGPVVSYHEWRASRKAGKTVQRQIQERRRNNRKSD